MARERDVESWASHPFDFLLRISEMSRSFFLAPPVRSGAKTDAIHLHRSSGAEETVVTVQATVIEASR